MGILDKKSRIMDVIVTPEGRRQMHSGDFRAEFVSFSDRSAYYASDSVTGSVAENASSRLYFEAKQLPIDKIVYETDSDGQLLGSMIDPNTRFFGEGGILIRDENGNFQKVPDDKFVKNAEGITSSSIDNLQKLKTISSVNSSKFNMEIEDNKVTFDITNSIPFGSLPYKNMIDLKTAEPIVYDKKLNNLTQFKFLPPKNINDSNYGEYTNNGGEGIDSFESLTKEIGYLPETNKKSLKSKSSYQSVDKNKKNKSLKQDIENLNKDYYNNNNVTQKKSFVFNNTNFRSNFMTQIYELNDINGSFNRLHIVNAGQFIDINNPDRSSKHVFYAGKVFNDALGVPVFINLFTLIFD